MDNMKIIITGALGHIGSMLLREVAEHFLQHEIILIDNISSERYCSLYDLPKRKFKFIQADLLELDLEKYLEPGDIVIHLAAMTNAVASIDTPELVFNNNFNSTSRVANACLTKQAYLFFPSSTSVYGDKNSIVDENCAIAELNPQSPYAKSKIAEENLLLQLASKENLKVVIARLGTIYGPSPGMRFHTAVNKFCWQAVQKLPMSVWRTAYYQKRPYLALDDAIAAIIYIMKNKIFDGEIYNIATQNHTVADIVTVIKKFLPKSEVNFVESKIMNQLSYNVATMKFQKKGFTFTGNIEQGIKATIAKIANCNC